MIKAMQNFIPENLFENEVFHRGCLFEIDYKISRIKNISFYRYTSLYEMKEFLWTTNQKIREEFQRYLDHSADHQLLLDFDENVDKKHLFRGTISDMGVHMTVDNLKNLGYAPPKKLGQYIDQADHYIISDKFIKDKPKKRRVRM